MQPWIGKSAGSSSSGSSTLHFDKTLSYLNNNHETHQQGQPQTFRTNKAQVHFEEKAVPRQKQPSNLFTTHYQPVIEPVLAPHQDIADGLEVLEFLNSSSYSDHIHDDDSKPSYRHHLDHQTALSEKEKLQMHWTSELLTTEDIVDYLLNTNYTEDIYGIPILGQYIKEAKQEASAEGTHKAVERLSMIRRHLMSESNGNVQAATQKLFEMKENDWSSFFS